MGAENVTMSFVVKIFVIAVIVFVAGVALGMFFIPHQAETIEPARVDQFRINAVEFQGTAGAANNYIMMAIQNRGISPFTISTSAKVNGIIKAATYAASSTSLTIAAGAVGYILIQNAGWSNGLQYSLELMTITGTKITYVAVAPHL